jgi:hypothetical protein
MSKKKQHRRDRPWDRARRRPAPPPESPESRRFREALHAEELAEVERVLGVAGIATAAVDGRRLLSLCRVAGVMSIAGVTVVCVVPRQQIGDFMDFDRRICSTGLSVFAREVVPSDDPIGPADAATHVLVRSLGPGVRARLGFEVRRSNGDA